VYRHAVGRSAGGLGQLFAPYLVAAVANADPVQGTQHDGIAGTQDHHTAGTQRIVDLAGRGISHWAAQWRRGIHVERANSDLAGGLIGSYRGGSGQAGYNKTQCGK
jgi:hypothetical protein